MKHIFLALFLIVSLLSAPAAQAGQVDAGVAPASAAAGELPLPHPILDTLDVRKAVAYCLDKDALIAVAYPDLPLADRQALRLDTLIPKSHWAYTAPTTVYPYDASAGKALLDGAGWLLQPGAVYRTKAGRELSLTLNTTDDPLRRAYTAVLQSQLAACGLRLTVNHRSRDWLFSETSGMARRDFEMASYSWSYDPDATTLLDVYGCEYVPSAANGWKWQNYAGVCSPQADGFMALGDDATKSQAERKALYAQALELLLQELPSIPLFQRNEFGYALEHLDLNLDLTVMSPTPQSHPITSDAAVRQAVAYCMDKDALIAASYPDLPQADRQALRLDTLIPKDHWAYTAPTTVYAYNVDAGRALLDGAGWLLQPGDAYRTKAGRELSLTLSTTTSPLRQAYAPVLQSQLAQCGMHLTLNHVDSNWLFGAETGLYRRDFELASFAWILNRPPEETTMADVYGCGYIPSPATDWGGQNIMGWCNPQADALFAQGDDISKTEAERKALYAQAVELVLQELPSIPLFQRGDALLTYEHLDFNLDTFNQAAAVDPAAETVLPVMNYDQQGSITIPAGAVSQQVDLRFHPLASPANLPDAGRSGAIAFQLDALVGGQPQPDFSFSQPIRVRMSYTDASVENIDETTLKLYLWDGSAWQDASLSCPVGSRYFSLDTALNTFAVDVCHLTEFALQGDTQYLTLIPVITR